MFFTIIMPFIYKEWRYIAIFALLGGLYFMVYNHGYDSCEADVQRASAEATVKAQEVADKESRVLIEKNRQEVQHSAQIQSKLDEELKKRQYTDCVVTSGGVRLLNQDN